MISTASAQQVSVEYSLAGDIVRAVDDATIEVRPGEILALVGESGSGKSTLAGALGGSLPANAEVVSGRIDLAGHDLDAVSAAQLRDLHANQVGFIEQDPLASLDPTARIGTQMRRALGIAGHAELTSLLEGVALRDPERVLRAYPGELSGGMAQRVCIAMAVARNPRLLIADEPTAALDASVKLEVLDLLVTWARDHGASILLLSHDLHLVRTQADRVAVMYGGRVVECGDAEAVMQTPQHPYTRALLASLPADAGFEETIEPIPGRPPTLRGPAAGCAFADRCAMAVDSCHVERPVIRIVAGRDVLCPVVAESPATTPAVPAHDRISAPKTKETPS